MKKRINKLKYFSAVLVLLLGLCAISGCVKQEGKQEKVVNKKSQIEENIKSGKVCVRVDADKALLDKKGKKIGKVIEGNKLILTSKNKDKYQINNSEYYISDKSLKVIDDFNNDNDFNRYQAFNDDLVTKKTKLYLDGKLKYSLNSSDTFEIMKKQDNLNYVVFNNELLSIKNEDIKEIKENVRSNNNAVKIPVFMFHFFYDSKLNEQPHDGNWYDVNMLKDDLMWAKNNNHQSLKMEDLDLWMDGAINLKQGSFIISMDDNNESVKRLAYPVFEDTKSLGTNFVITSWTDDFESIKSDYVELQSHSDQMHQGGCKEGHGGRFLCNSLQEGIDDVTLSSQKLGGANVFCYPFGDSNAHTKEVLKASGYTLAFTTQYGYTTRGLDKLELPRIRMSTGYGVDYFSKILEG